jgi:cell division transport system permease protein
MQKKQKRHKNPLRLGKNYLLRHLQAATNSIGQISRTPLSALMTCVVIGIALALPAALFVLLKNGEVLSQQFKSTTEITLYLKPTTTAAQVSALTTALKNNPDISQATPISPSAGLKELQQQVGQENLTANLQTNPLPWAITVVPAATFQTPEALAELSHALKQSPEVDSVQMDVLWVQRLFSFMSLAQRILYALAVFLGIGVLLIVNNCIRSVTLVNKKEIDVIKLIGGTHAFIRRPFLYVGVVYGLLGGIVAWQLVDLLLWWLADPVAQLAALYQSQFHLLSITLSDTFILLFSSIALSLAGSWLAVTRFLKSPSIS